MIWDFWVKYCDEAYTVIDKKDSWIDPTTEPLDIVLLESELNEMERVNSGPFAYPMPPPSRAPVLSPCKRGNTAAKILNVIPWLLHRKGRFYYMNPPSE